ncbi:hypothetical protein AVEN_275736-1 [Araneus ventricosus]|uniref:Histone-lysine N-methyltransferase SETMAR n=1 Tax=Araneus ventricosus TaxID=182803 RepID=A0A4Y2LVW8_ARAVE|nr:hypothetical protein AVEN_275736-1 [Araneus ventricosus]
MCMIHDCMLHDSPELTLNHCVHINSKFFTFYVRKTIHQWDRSCLVLKEFLGGKRFGSDEELENAVTTWLNELAAEEYDMGILKLLERYDKSLNVGGDHVEK